MASSVLPFTPLGLPIGLPLSVLPEAFTRARPALTRSSSARERRTMGAEDFVAAKAGITSRLHEDVRLCVARTTPLTLSAGYGSSPTGPYAVAFGDPI